MSSSSPQPANETTSTGSESSTRSTSDHRPDPLYWDLLKALYLNVSHAYDGDPEPDWENLVFVLKDQSFLSDQWEGYFETRTATTGGTVRHVVSHAQIVGFQEVWHMYRMGIVERPQALYLMQLPNREVQTVADRLRYEWRRRMELKGFMSATGARERARHKYGASEPDVEALQKTYQQMVSRDAMIMSKVPTEISWTTAPRALFQPERIHQLTEMIPETYNPESTPGSSLSTPGKTSTNTRESRTPSSYSTSRDWLGLENGPNPSSASPDETTGSC